MKERYQRLDVPYAVAQDNDGGTWRAYRTRYWPTLFLIDKRGHLRYTHIGEGAYAETEQAIQDLLKEDLPGRTTEMNKWKSAPDPIVGDHAGSGVSESPAVYEGRGGRESGARCWRPARRNGVARQRTQRCRRLTRAAASTKGDKDELGNALTSYEAVTGYNNYYEFTTDKEGVAPMAKDFKTRPWTVEVSGLVNKPRTYDIDELMKRFPIEERIYRLRCVEAWSMVIPWQRLRVESIVEGSRADGRGEVRALRVAFSIPSRCRGRPVRSTPGRTAKGCASTRPCTI